MEQKNYSIELLRIGAILMLIFYHVSLLAWDTHPGSGVLAFLALGRMGWTGSDLFLAIGGFLCYRSIKNRYQGRWGYFRYLGRRITRITPSYYLFLLFYLTLGLMILKSVGKDFALKEGFGAALLSFVCNYPLSAGGWSGVALEGMFSLSIIMQLFLLFGGIIFYIKDDRKVLWMLGIFEAGAIILRLFFHGGGFWKSYFFTFSRLDAFLGGIAIGLLNANPETGAFLKKHSGKLLLAAASLAAITGVLTKGFSPWSGYTDQIAYPVLAILAAGLINLSLHKPLKAEVLKKIAFLGRFSYPIYLFKLPTAYFLFSVIYPPSGSSPSSAQTLLFSGAAFITCYTVAAVWWFLIENPLRLLFRKKPLLQGP